jgi:hypothetical protein
VEFKDSLIGDHLSPAYSPRLRKLGVSGSAIDNIAIGAFAGITRYVTTTTTTNDEFRSVFFNHWDVDYKNGQCSFITASESNKYFDVKVKRTKKCL